jgi:hypothetical protein
MVTNVFFLVIFRFSLWFLKMDIYKCPKSKNLFTIWMQKVEKNRQTIRNHMLGLFRYEEK